jgi:hypothetical protein
VTALGVMSRAVALQSAGGGQRHVCQLCGMPVLVRTARRDGGLLLTSGISPGFVRARRQGPRPGCSHEKEWPGRRRWFECYCDAGWRRSWQRGLVTKLVTFRSELW